MATAASSFGTLPALRPLRRPLLRRHDLPSADPHQDRQITALLVDRRLQRQHLVKDRPQGVDVAARVDGADLARRPAPAACKQACPGPRRPGSGRRRGSRLVDDFAGGAAVVMPPPVEVTGRLAAWLPSRTLASPNP